MSRAALAGRLLAVRCCSWVLSCCVLDLVGEAVAVLMDSTSPMTNQQLGVGLGRRAHQLRDSPLAAFSVRCDLPEDFECVLSHPWNSSHNWVCLHHTIVSERTEMDIVGLNLIRLRSGVRIGKMPTMPPA